MNNSFKISIRIFLKNPVSNLINILGLVIAIGCCFVVYVYVDFEFSIDEHHLKKDNIFLLTQSSNKVGDVKTYGYVPIPLGMTLSSSHSEVISHSNVKDIASIVRNESRSFNETVRFTDKSFLKMFTFPLEVNNINPEQSLSDLDNVVLSHNMAIKHFGTINQAIGSSLRIYIDSSFQRTFIVSDVAKPFPKSSSIRFDFLCRIENLYTTSILNENDWGVNVDASFIETRTRKIPADLNLDMYVQQNNEISDFEIESFNLVRFSQLYENSIYIEDDISGALDKGSVILLIIVAFLIFLLACFNYMNISIAHASDRFTEIGVRKSYGASRFSIIFQHVIEKTIESIIAAILGLVVGWGLLLPAFNRLISWEIQTEYLNLKFFTFLLFIVLLTVIGSGLYPAFYVSRMQTLQILRNRATLKKNNFFSKSFLLGQFIITGIVAIASVFTILNSNYQKNRSWGYSHEDLVFAPVKSQSDYDFLLAELQSQPGIDAISGTKDHIGISDNKRLIAFQELNVEASHFEVDTDYIGTSGLELIDGRNFNASSNNRDQVIVNEKMVESLQLLNPINEQFKFGDRLLTIIGVVNNFHYKSFLEPIEPAFISLYEPSEVKYIVVRSRTNGVYESLDALKEIWFDSLPNQPFEGDVQLAIYKWYYEGIHAQVILIVFIAVVSIILSCLGLYGLITVKMKARIKELSIRSVLGAGIDDIFFAMSKSLLMYIGGCLIISGFIGYFFTMSAFEVVYRDFIPLDITPIFLIITFIYLFTISIYLIKIFQFRSFNPVEGLRME